MLFQAYGQVILSLALSYIVEDGMLLPTLSQAVTVVGLGLLGVVGQIFMTKGMQREKSGLTSAMRMWDVLFAFVWQVLFLNDEPITLMSVFGAALLVMGMLLMIASKAMTAPLSWRRRCFKMSFSHTKIVNFHRLRNAPLEPILELSEEEESPRKGNTKGNAYSTVHSEEDADIFLLDDEDPDLDLEMDTLAPSIPISQ
jgi:hypothetical protein